MAARTEMATTHTEEAATTIARTTPTETVLSQTRAEGHSHGKEMWDALEAKFGISDDGSELYVMEQFYN
uniref:Uncharacterized protein n=1 Tax=Oryza brachyantha TaxID=4533 RepID=J3N1B4_ORYBR